MYKILATIGVLAVGGGLSICGLCGNGSSSTVAASLSPQVVSIGQAATPSGQSRVGWMTESLTTRQAVKTETVTLKVAGMTCGGCVYGVRTVLTRLSGVSKADVSYEQSKAVITYNPAAVTVGKMIAAIKTLGYIATAVAPATRS